MAKRSEVVRKKRGGRLRLGAALAGAAGKEVSGAIPKHLPADGARRACAIDEEVLCTAGGETTVTGAGDFVLMPLGVRNKIERVGGGNAYFATGAVVARRPPKHHLAGTNAEE